MIVNGTYLNMMFTCSCWKLTNQRSQFTCEGIYFHAGIRRILAQLLCEVGSA